MTAKRTTTSKRSRPAASSTSKLVHLEFHHPTARQVFVAGSFNDWHPSVTEMIDRGEGRWTKELTLAPGVYEYRLVVDGEWVTDPQVEEKVANGLGSENSVLRVA